MKLIFLHGSGCSPIVWEQQLAHFGQGIALSLPGHPEGEAFDNVEASAKWLHEILDQAPSDEVVLVGHSLGSAIALQAAIIGHTAIKGLVLIGSGARLKVLPAILQGLSYCINKGLDIPDAVLASNQGIAEPWRSRINTDIKNNGVKTLLRDFTACDHFDVMQRVSDLNIPARVIVGEKDQMTPPKYAQFLQDSLPQSELQIIEGGSHMVFAEQAGKVNRIIDEFVAGLIINSAQKFA